MCGFVGLVGCQRNQPLLEAMTNLIEHRGPDDFGYYVDNDVQLGFRRLSIIDLHHGHQPFSYDNDRYMIIFNGEIYNHIEIRDMLLKDGYTFETQSDTETIVALYSKIGENVVKELRGMFAFVIWDKEKKEIFAARDQFGIKPFYYTCINNELIFASESKAIWHYLQNTELDNGSLQHYLSFQYVPEPNTIFNNIFKLEPGTFLKKESAEKIITKKYWTPTFQPVKRESNEVKSQILSSLRDSVQVHMRSDVPVGSFLSSGIDSTTIVALAKEINPKIKTFTVGFEQDGFSEIDIAQETANDLGVDNINYIISPEEYLKELPKIIWHLDEPIADPSAIPLYFVARLARKHVKVVLSGEGADELFGGYPIYHEPLSLKGFSLLPNSSKKMLLQISELLPNQMKGKSFLQRGSTPIENRFIGNAKIMSEHEKSLLLKNYDPTKPYTTITHPIYAQCKNYDDVLKMQFVDLHTWLRGDILAKADKMTMANSLELRVPFLDKQVFSVARELMTSTKITRKTTKAILREAVKEVIPPQIFMRKKLGFPVPIRHWLKNEWYDWALKVINESQTDHLFNKHYIFQLLENHCLGKEDNSRKLWSILIFMLWHQIFKEGLYELNNEVYELSNSSVF